MIAIGLILLFAQATQSPPSCKDGKATCKPWERAWSNPYDQFDLKPVEPKSEQLGPEPHTLIIADGSAMTRIDYRSGSACGRARDATRKQLGITKIRTFCVPR